MTGETSTSSQSSPIGRTPLEGSAAVLPSILQDAAMLRVLSGLECTQYSLIAPTDVQDLVRDHGHGAWPKTFVTPETAWTNGLLADCPGALVLMPRGERGMVRRLERAYPGTPVLSFTYDVLTGAAAQKYGTNTVPNSEAANLMVLSVPGNEAEYFGAVLAASGYGQMYEWLGEAHGRLAPWQSDLNPLGVHNRAQASVTDRGVSLLQADTLVALIDAGRLDPKRARLYLKASDTKLIYFARRDKVGAAVLVDHLKGSGFRSIWTEPHTDPGQFDHLREQSPTACLSKLIALEDRFETWVKPLKDRVKMIYFEDLIEQPYAVMTELKTFLGPPRGQGRAVPRYDDRAANVGWLEPASKALRRDLVTLLGLRLNAEGSLVSPSAALFGEGRTAPQAGT